MADDPMDRILRVQQAITDELRIREAKQAVIGAVLSYADACERDLQPSQKAKALLAVDDAFDALIAAVRAETLAEYTLTDTEVDKFLEACEKPQDPERVERIRKLFQQKLSDYGRLL